MNNIEWYDRHKHYKLICDVLEYCCITGYELDSTSHHDNYGKLLHNIYINEESSINIYHDDLYELWEDSIIKTKKKIFNIK